MRTVSLRTMVLLLIAAVFVGWWACPNRGYASSHPDYPFTVVTAEPVSGGQVRRFTSIEDADAWAAAHPVKMWRYAAFPDLPQCRTDDERGCKWDARANGNGLGRSFWTTARCTHYRDWTVTRCAS